MFRSTFSMLGAAVLAITFSGVSAAQVDSPIPIGDVGGYAGRELNRIKNQSIGTGYSAESLNRIALNNAMARVPNVGQLSTSTSAASIGLGLGAPTRNKPFSNYSPEPTVSPYMNLFRDDDFDDVALNYNTLVRPQLRQQRINSQMQKQNMELARRVQAISAQPNFNPRGSTSMYPTGHQTVFMYLGHYYPALNRQRR